MHKRRIRYPVVYARARQHKLKVRPYLMEIIWSDWGQRLYCESGTNITDNEHFVRYRFFKRYRPRGGHTGWNLDKDRFFCSGVRRTRRRHNWNINGW